MRCVLASKDVAHEPAEYVRSDAVGRRHRVDSGRHGVRPPASGLDPLRVSLRPPLSTAVAKLPDQFLFLRVHRHYRLPQALKSSHPPVDVFELRVAIRMLPAFQRLAVGLQAVAQLVQQPVHRPFADTVTGNGQFRRQACRAAAGPQQRPHRVAAGDRIDQPLQFLRQALVLCSQSLASRPAPARAHGLGSCPSGLLASEFFQTGANGRPRHTGGCGYAGYPATPDTACFDCRPAAPQAFVEQRIKGDKLGLDGFGQGEVHHEAAVYHTSPKDHIILARLLRVQSSPGQTRTADMVVNSHPLYQLSYRGMGRSARPAIHIGNGFCRSCQYPGEPRVARAVEAPALGAPL